MCRYYADADTGVVIAEVTVRFVLGFLFQLNVVEVFVTSCVGKVTGCCFVSFNVVKAVAVTAGFLIVLILLVECEL